MKRALSVVEFCTAYGISRPTYYRAEKAGLMPVAIRLGGRVLITETAIAEWERRKLAEAKQRETT